MAPLMAVDLSGGADTQAPVFFEKLSVNGVAARRAKAPGISKVIAAHASSDMFKGPVRILWATVGTTGDVNEVGEEDG